MGDTLLTLSMTLTLTLTLSHPLTLVIDPIPCPYEECSCDNESISCNGLGLKTLPVLKNGSFSQTILDISDNQISSISGGQLPGGLKTISCSYNRISHITDDAFTESAHTLNLLECWNNQLTGIPDLSDLHNLQYMSLDNNSIPTVPADHLPDSLLELHLEINHLTHISGLGYPHNQQGINTFMFPSSLQVLDLEFNQIENISSITFQNNNKNNTSALTILYLCHNPISQISEDAFSQLRNLQKLNLSHTRLTRLPLALMTLTHLSYLDLSDLPDMACTCQEARLATWYRALQHPLILLGHCQDGHTVVYFLTELAPLCPKS